jgi:sugar/nucleoside kinase (ribokinase family)
MTPAFDVLGIGENSVDIVLGLPAVPSPLGDRNKLRITHRHVLCGGQTATALTACARLGLRACYLGAFGDDEYGRLIKSQLEQEGVDLSRARVCQVPNRYAVILIDVHTGERMVLWEKDDQLAVPADAIDEGTVRQVRLLHVDDTGPAVALRAARLARAAGVPVTCDVDQVTSRTRDLLEAISIVIVAEHVPQQLTGLADHEQALRRLRAWHGGLLVVTLGARGCMALQGDHLHYAPGFSVGVVDTTGAGDVFRGAFIYAYLQNWPADRVLRFANAAAAVSVGRLGAMNGAPTMDEVETLLDGA